MHSTDCLDCSRPLYLDLGVIMASDLKWSKHVEQIVHKANRVLSNLFNKRKQNWPANKSLNLKTQTIRTFIVQRNISKQAVHQITETNLASLRTPGAHYTGGLLA